MRMAGLIAAFVIAAPATVFAVPNRDPVQAPKGMYVIHPQHANLYLSANHGGFANFNLRFDKIDAHYDYDPAHPDATKVFVEVDTNSISTGTKDSDERFKSNYFLNVMKFPKMTYVIDEIHRTDMNHGTITGDLAFMGVTKRTTFNATFDGFGPGPGAEERYMKMGFSANGTIKRSDWGFTSLPTLFSDELKVTIEVEFVKDSLDQPMVNPPGGGRRGGPPAQ